MRRIVKKTVLYQCSQCKTEYTNAKKAKACESGTVEEKLGRGIIVRSPHTPHTCDVEGKIRGCFVGQIERVEGPFPFDPEYMVKGNGNIWPSPRPGHVFKYLCAFSCPICKKDFLSLHFGPELTPLETDLFSRPPV